MNLNTVVNWQFSSSNKMNSIMNWIFKYLSELNTNMKNVVNMYSVDFKVVFIQNYIFNTKNEMKLNMNMDSLRFFWLNMNCNSTIQSYSCHPNPGLEQIFSSGSFNKYYSYDIGVCLRSSTSSYCLDPIGSILVTV